MKTTRLCVGLLVFVASASSQSAFAAEPAELPPQYAEAVLQVEGMI